MCLQRLLRLGLILLLCLPVGSAQQLTSAQTNQAKASWVESIEKRLNVSGLNSRTLNTELLARPNSGILLPNFARSFGSLHSSFKEKDLVDGNAVPLPSQLPPVRTPHISAPSLNFEKNREFGFTDLPKDKLTPENANPPSINKAVKAR